MSGNSIAQQNHSLFLMHYLPESNLLNPAVPISCKWYIGVPVLSSTHLNYANSAFSLNTAFNKTDEGSYVADVDNVVKRMGRRSLLGTEIHTQLLALGFRSGDYSLMFTLTEKNNIPITYPKEAIQLAWDGNSQFEGEEAGLKGSGLYFNHYREYALSLSKHVKDGLYWGIRAKLLFGKLNVATRSTDISLHTDANTYNLNFNGDLLAHSSLPIVVEHTDGRVSGVSYDENADIMELAFNRKNPGFALDFGIIYPYSDRLQLSAALIDLGAIRWRSNLNTFKGDGEFQYQGPFNDTIIEFEGYVDHLIQVFSDSMNLVAEPQKYTTTLPTRLLIGANYKVSNKLKTGVQGEILAYRTKVIPSLSVSANYNIFGYTYLMASYTFQYNNFQNLGFGFTLGRNPFQFYMISDNVLGFIWPKSARNVNLRFGLNINLGCKARQDESPGRSAVRGNCYWLEESNRKNYQKQKRRK